jgi:hypothetical protein
MSDPLYDPALGRPLVEWPAVIRGAAVGLVLIIPVTILGAVLDRAIDDFEDSALRVALLVLILAAYFVSGHVAGRLAQAPWTNGALAGLGAFVLWIPVRVVIWLVRDENRGLFTGDEPVLKIGQIFGQLVLATALGMLGGYFGARRGSQQRTQ